MSDEKRSLVRKLSEVMAAVKRIPKNGVNRFHNYKYAMESDVLDVVRDELSKRNVMMLPRVLSEKIASHATKSGGAEYIGTVTVCFDFHDGDSGETLPVITVGQGQDAGDKSFYKALTGATKYALMKTFLIPTGDDPDADESTDRANEVRATKPQPPEPRAVAPHNPQTGEVVAVFPNYGKTAGMPIKGASFNDLQFYKNGALRSIADPSKSRFHDRERALLAAIEAELGAATQPAQEEAF